VQSKPPLDELPEVQKLVAKAEHALAGSGRVLLRYSGTEPKIRLLIEGREASQINGFADEIAAALKTSIGA
jgi:phosphoglucosamine mutase